MLSEWLFARGHPAREVNRVGRVFHVHLPIDEHAGVEVKLQRKHRTRNAFKTALGEHRGFEP
jgi:hypothetical protein